MNQYEPASSGPVLPVRSSFDTASEAGLSAPRRSRRRIVLRVLLALAVVIGVLGVIGLLYGRHWLHQAIHDSLPQVDGSLSIAGLTAPVTVQRDDHGIPHIHAATLDDLIVAQGYITAQDRLWQMETLRRHAAGTLAEVLGPGLILHDRAQRFLQIRASADRALSVLPADQLHFLELYSRGVNASIEAQRAHLPLEFRLLRFEPAAWTPKDTLLVSLAMFQDLTNTFPGELDREALSSRMPLTLLSDLYPIGSWRDHPPTQPIVDLTAPQENIPDVPLDESQTKLTTPEHIQDLLNLRQTLRNPVCEGCFAGSNNWVVSGAHTATGKPLLSNDMHLAHNVPGIWYEADLEAPTPNGDFHVAGVSLPGAPFIVVGHNAHVAWGFTNLGATVQDVWIEHTRGTGSAAEYQTATGAWQPLLHQQEILHVKGSKDVVLDVTETQHGSITAPIISPILPSETRALSLQWTIYDPANLVVPFYDINAAGNAAGLVAAFSTFGGPSQNLVYADNQGHIGYHSVGKIPVRGNATTPTALSPVPTDALDTTQQWAGYIPYSALPQTVDPPNGMLATANASIVPDGYPFPITLNWAAPYRNERIWKLLSEKAIATHDHLTPADMLAIQTDVYSDVDHVIAQRMAYAIDHAGVPAFAKDKRLHQAADLLRDWNGSVDADAAAPAIVDAAKTALWTLLLTPQYKADATHPAADALKLYSWGEKSFAQEWLVMHTPARWLPAKYHSWDELLSAAVARGLADARAPYDLKKWHYGEDHPIDIEHPIYSQSPLLQRLIGLPTGTGPQPQSGDGTTIKQVGHTFGPSERFTANLADPDQATLNLVLGESGNPASPWFMDQWSAWYHGTTYTLPFTKTAVDTAATHTLTLTPK